MSKLNVWDIAVLTFLGLNDNKKKKKKKKNMVKPQKALLREGPNLNKKKKCFNK